MFFLEDGRPQLYQWDLNRRLRISDPKVTEVHFCNGSDDCALVVKTYTDDTYDGNLYADIPNIILQSDLPIKAYAYINDTYTQDCLCFKVIKRNKPSDYVYEETEVLQYSTILHRVEELENNITDTVAEEVATYIEQNPIEVDLSNYYNKAETDALVDKAIDNIEIPTVDLTPYATKQFVADEIAKIDIPEPDVDLTGYATEDWVNNQGFIKEHQSLEGYATEKYVDDAIANIDIPEGGGGVKAVFIDASNVTASSSAIPEEYLPIFQKYDSGEDRNCLFYVKLNSATYYQPASIYCPEEQILSLDFGMTQNYDAEIYYKSLVVRLNTSDWYINTRSTTFATKYYVDNLFANIATAEGGSY